MLYPIQALLIELHIKLKNYIEYIVVIVLFFLLKKENINTLMYPIITLSLLVKIILIL